MTFKAASMALQNDAGVRFFALLSPRDSEGQILSSDKLGHSTLYDADANCVTAMPVLAGRLGCHPITISLSRPDSDLLPQDLYVMHSAASTYWDDAAACCFAVLRFGGDDLRLPIESWCWDPLPAPPLGKCTPICSHAVVGGDRAIICVSAQEVPGYGPSPATDGTYCFDTVEREWSRAGDWMLPFEGGAQHVLVPGLGGGLWLGFTNRGRNLCAASGLEMETETAPALQHVWRDALQVPGNWRPTCPKLVGLGGGRFCIARTCMVMADEEYDEYSGPGIAVAVLSGVELLLTGGGDSDSDRPPGSIDIVEHKSVGYICRSDSISWVL